MSWLDDRRSEIAASGDRRPPRNPTRLTAIASGRIAWNRTIPATANCFAATGDTREEKRRRTKPLTPSRIENEFEWRTLQSDVCRAMTVLTVVVQRVGTHRIFFHIRISELFCLETYPDR